MAKYFISSDIHSFYDEWITALTNAGFDREDKDHHIIICGDLFDRGDKSKECLDFVVRMLQEGRAICIRGNHEELMEMIFERGYIEVHDIHNKTSDTIKQLTMLPPEASIEDMIEDVRRDEALRFYLMKCKNYYELGDNIFVHGWIPCQKKYAQSECKLFVGDTLYSYFDTWRDANEMYWQQARWVNGMMLWDQGVKEPGKTIYCGHWNSSWGHCHLHHDGKEFLREFETFYIDPITGKQEPHANHDTFKDEGIVALDATTVLSHKVNVEVIEI